MEKIKELLDKHKVKASFVGGALVVSTAYGSCQMMAPPAAESPAAEEAPAEEAPAEEAPKEEAKAEEPAESE
jgi:2-oxoglutarate dehydrogenase E2 component (dihydrolipoamide succinyltransferase)